MQKFFTILLSTLLALGAAAMAETAFIEPITGTLVEIRDDGAYLVEQFTGEEILVLRDEETWIQADAALSVGDVLIVTYSGAMTRSLPPQVMALSIASHSLEGAVLEVDVQGNRLLINSLSAGQVWATLPEGADAASYAGGAARVYTNGVMALSYPGQVGALSVSPVYLETGAITELSAQGMTLAWGEGTLVVHYDGTTKLLGEFEVGMEVVVAYSGAMTRSLPPQIFGLAIAPVQE